MPRNMSFFYTTAQILDRSKDVTRRLGWKSLIAGEEINAIEKGQGLKSGEKVKHLARIRIISARRERLYSVTKDDVRREGFPEMTQLEFMEMFRRANDCGISDYVTRIEFEYID